MNTDDFKKALRESLLSGFAVKEKLEPHVDELAGSLIAAGPQKVADAISKMDEMTFAEFAKKIDGKGILMVTKQFSNTDSADSIPQDNIQTDIPQDNQSVPEKTPVQEPAPTNQELKDL